MAKKTTSGFTLIELLITSAITLVASFLTLMILVQNNNLLYRQNAVVSEGLGLNTVVNTLNDDIHSTSFVATSYPIVSPLYTTGLNTLVLAIPSIDSGGNVIGNTYDYIVIYKDSTNPLWLKRSIFPDVSSSRKSASQILLNQLKSVQFFYYDINNNVVTPANAAKINFAVSVSQKAGLDTPQSSASAIVSLRNN